MVPEDITNLSVTLPAEPTYIGVARRFAVDVARHAQVDDEALADVELAVSEACSAIIALREIAPANGGISIGAAIDGSLRFEIEDAGVSFLPRPGESATTAPSRVSELDTARTDLIRALFPGAAIGTTGTGRLSVQFTTQLAAS